MCLRHACVPSEYITGSSILFALMYSHLCSHGFSAVFSFFFFFLFFSTSDFTPILRIRRVPNGENTSISVRSFSFFGASALVLCVWCILLGRFWCHLRRCTTQVLCFVAVVPGQCFAYSFTIVIETIDDDCIWYTRDSWIYKVNILYWVHYGIYLTR